MSLPSKIDNFSLHLIKDCKYAWSASSWSNNTPNNSNSAIFYSLNFSQVTLPWQEDNKFMLHTISELLQKESLQNLKYITIWVKWTEDAIAFDVEINKELRAALEDLLPSSYQFRIKGNVSCEITHRVNPNPHGRNHRTMSVHQIPYIITPLISKTKNFDSLFQLDQDNKAEFLMDDRQSFISKALFRQGEYDGAHLIWNWNVSVEWNDVSPIKISADWIITRSYDCDKTKDVTILLGDGNEVECHGFILGAHSQPLAAAISWDNRMKELRSGRVEMKDLSYSGANYLLPYFYGRKLPVMDLSCDMAFELFQVAHIYDISEGMLEKKMEELFLYKGIGWYTPDVIMQLYFMTKNIEKFESLSKHSLKNMRKMTDVIRHCDCYKELSKDNALELLWTLLNSS